MPIIDPSQLVGVEHPEFVMGLVAPVGTPLRHLSQQLADLLARRGYQADVVKLSDFLRGFRLDTPEPEPGAGEYARIDALMSRGNDLRRTLAGGEALALLAAAHIHSLRPSEAPRQLANRAFVLHQLKHPDEAVWLRTIYGSAFHLISVHCPESVRRQYLNVGMGLSREEADRLIERDRGEESRYGQHLTSTFHHGDVFVDVRGFDEVSVADAREQLERYVRLLLGEAIITPTREEYGMFLAQAAAYRSADLSRQVGAAILTERGEVVALGTNEVPSAGGGQYWPGRPAHRDVEEGYDANAVMKTEVVAEIVEAFTPGWHGMDAAARIAAVRRAEEELAGTRLMSLTEFGRAVHAEMEALSAAGRTGRSVSGCELYTTTFPCHNCAKHIVSHGIATVVYVEPYPKSLAARLHGDAIRFPQDDAADERVLFKPFSGVAPRAYPALFSSQTPEGKRIARKDSSGAVRRQPVGLRAKASAFTHIDREAVISLALRKLEAKLLPEHGNGTDT